MKIMHGARHNIKNVCILQTIPRTDIVRKSLSTLNDGESEGGMYRAYICAHSRNVCIGKHHKYIERRTDETYAFTLDSDRARVSKLYSLFHAGKPRERLDQPDPTDRTRTE